MKGSEFIFDYVHLLNCYRNKINSNRGGSYLDSPDWINNKNAITIALNHEEIGKNSERRIKIK